MLLPTFFVNVPKGRNQPEGRLLSIPYSFRHLDGRQVSSAESLFLPTERKYARRLTFFESAAGLVISIDPSAQCAPQRKATFLFGLVRIFLLFRRLFRFIFEQHKFFALN